MRNEGNLESEHRNYDWRRALNRGLDMAIEDARRGSTVDDEQIMWALLQDAAMVSGIAYGPPPRTGFPVKSAMPETPPDVSTWALMKAYLDGTLEEMPEMENTRPQVTTEQISRAEKVLSVFHHYALVHKGTWAKLRKAVYLKACGVPDRKITKVTGLTRHQIRRAKEAACRDMADFVYRVAQ